jgi:hypothetical protein
MVRRLTVLELKVVGVLCSPVRSGFPMNIGQQSEHAATETGADVATGAAGCCWATVFVIALGEEPPAPLQL